MLAILETLVFGLFVVLLLAYVATPDTWVLPLLVPLFLLRSEHSTALGAAWFKRLVNVLRENTKKRSQRAPSLPSRPQESLPRQKAKAYDPAADRFDALVLAGLFGFGVLFLRATATLVSFARHPLSALQAIPGNWFRIVFCEDLRTPIHLPPGVSNYDLDDPDAGELGFSHRLSIRDSFRRFPLRAWITSALWFGFCFWFLDPRGTPKTGQSWTPENRPV